MYNVLFVDLNAQSGEKPELMLNWSQMGFQLKIYATTPSAALAALEHESAFLVLLNMKCFQTDGLSLCGQIRQRSRVPIILIGGDHDFALARKALTYQVSDYLADPVQISELMSSLQAVKRELDTGNVSDSSRLSAAQQKNQAQLSIVDVVKNYVQKELHKNVTLKEISNALHFNCAYLGQKFKSEEKMSFHEYLLQQRMEKAKRLLEQTDMRIYEIANEVGYTEIDWFYKKFKEYTGTSANEYRKQFSFTA